MLATVVALSAGIYSLVKNGRKFLANMVNQSNNAIINTAISVLGVVLSYLFDPSMLKLWIFFLVLGIIDLCMPPAKLNV